MNTDTPMTDVAVQQDRVYRNVTATATLSRRLERDRAELIAALENAADALRIIADKAAPTVAKYSAVKRDVARATLARVKGET